MIRLGLRLAVTGGRSARTRAALTAGGVAVGVIVLLVAASVPTMIHRLDQRQAARDLVPGQRGALLFAAVDTTFRADDIRGARLQAIRPGAAMPPGLRGLPAPGELVVSPALRKLLAAEPLLRERLPGRIAGTIAPSGLTGPRDLSYYTGAGDLRPREAVTVSRFGTAVQNEPLPAFLVLIVAVGVVVLLLPVAVFVATAVRFGSDERDRRLAALRLVGADRSMAVRIAAGEALFGALAGMLLGVTGFYALRPFAEHLSLADVSVFAADIRPNPVLLALVLVAVPLAALVASIVALRRVVVEPLGVSRQGAQARRRLWWRLLPLAAGTVLLGAEADALASGTDTPVAEVSVGVTLMLVGMTALLPWVVDAVVGRLRGGGVPWQLAVRRLQMDGGTAARAVAGVAVAVAGAIALQTVLSVGEDRSTFATGVDLSRAQAVAGVPRGDRDAVIATLRGATGVRSVLAVGTSYRGRVPVNVGDCAALREFGRLGTCRDGDVFVTDPAVRPGRRIKVAGGSFTVPARARRAPVRVAPEGYEQPGVLVTEGGWRGLPVDEVSAYLRLDGTRDAIEHVRNTLVRLRPDANATPLNTSTELRAYRQIRRGIFAGAFVVLALIAASLLVGGLEQLRERRSVLAALSAFGVPRGTLARSVLWQATVPVLLGLAVSVTVGLALAALLLRVGGQSFEADWTAIAAMTVAGGLVIGLVTVATLPALSRLMRPEGLRTE